MLTYSRILSLVTSRPAIHFSSCAVSSKCVQAQRKYSKIATSVIISRLNFGNQFPMLMSTTLTSLSTANIRIGYSCQKFSSLSQNVYDSNEIRTGSIRQHEEFPSGEMEGSLESCDDDGSNELEQKRFIWNVGPAVRPSSSIASFVNDSVLLQEFLKMGVELYRWDKLDPSIVEYILKLDFQKDVGPYIRFLVDNGVPPSGLSVFFGKNPMILQEDLRNLNIRIQYLKSKAFSTEQIQSIIISEPFWLSQSTTQVDQRLGFFQTTFKLTGAQIRELATKGARTITTKRTQITEITFKIKEEMGFEPKEIVTILLSHPSIWRQRPETIWRRFDYLHNIAKFSHEMIARSAKLLLTREGRLRGRIGYLQHLGRAQFNSEKPNFVSVEDIVSGEDAHFAVMVAKGSVIHFNEYLKSL